MLVDMSRIPTLDEQITLAEKVRRSLGPFIELGGRRFRVARYANEIRFFEYSPKWGGPGDEAHIQILRDDLATAPPLPREYQDRKLAQRCKEIVESTLRAFRK